MITTTTPNFNNILNELMNDLSQFESDQFITVGVHESEAARDDGPLTNAQIGAVQHFGNDHIPARPWLDVGVESVTEELGQTIEDAIEDGENLDQILNRLGVIAVAGVQEYITALNTPPNAASTIRMKGSSNPLIDSGELRASVTYQITGGTPSEGL